MDYLSGGDTSVFSATKSMNSYRHDPLFITNLLR
jgi:hypothetical protein